MPTTDTACAWLAPPRGAERKLLRRGASYATVAFMSIANILAAWGAEQTCCPRVGSPSSAYGPRARPARLGQCRARPILRAEFGRTVAAGGLRRGRAQALRHRAARRLSPRLAPR